MGCFQKKREKNLNKFNIWKNSLCWTKFIWILNALRGSLGNRWAWNTKRTNKTDVIYEKFFITMIQVAHYLWCCGHYSNCKGFPFLPHTSILSNSNLDHLRQPRYCRRNTTELKKTKQKKNDQQPLKKHKTMKRGEKKGEANCSYFHVPYQSQYGMELSGVTLTFGSCSPLSSVSWRWRPLSLWDCRSAHSRSLRVTPRRPNLSSSRSHCRDFPEPGPPDGIHGADQSPPLRGCQGDWL